VIWRWDSTPFGDSAPNEDPDGDGSTLTLNLRFPGQYYDAESELSYNYYRDYDPATGRYVESDPIGLAAGSITYAYVKSNSVRYVDPTGRLHLVASSRNSLGEDVGGTVFCDGNGGLEPVIAPGQDTCVTGCMLRHEKQHVDDFKVAAPTICRGKPRHNRVEYDNEAERAHFELIGWKEEYKCLREPPPCDRSNCALSIVKRKAQALGHIKEFGG